MLRIDTPSSRRVFARQVQCHSATCHKSPRVSLRSCPAVPFQLNPPGYVPPFAPAARPRVRVCPLRHIPCTLPSAAPFLALLFKLKSLQSRQSQHTHQYNKSHHQHTTNHSTRETLLPRTPSVPSGRRLTDKSSRPAAKSRVIAQRTPQPHRHPARATSSGSIVVQVAPGASVPCSQSGVGEQPSRKARACCSREHDPSHLCVERGWRGVDVEGYRGRIRRHAPACLSRVRDTSRLCRVGLYWRRCREPSRGQGKTLRASLPVAVPSLPSGGVVEALTEASVGGRLSRSVRDAEKRVCASAPLAGTRHIPSSPSGLPEASPQREN